VTMCFEGESIEVAQCEVKTYLAEGAICGGCDELCCPGQTGKKIDMCLNGNTINVSHNACDGIKQAGGTCGPCPAEPED
jgi:hypothetical protein